MSLLAVDTSTRICSVAIKDNRDRVFERTATGLGIHSEKLFVFLEELIDEADLDVSKLDAVLLAGGPGSFTGLRIGSSGVKGLLFNKSVDLYGINTLAYFAACCRDLEPGIARIHGVLDARRVHLYHQLYNVDDMLLNPVDDVEIIPIEEFKNHIKPGDAIVGTGINRLPESILSELRIFNESIISASGLFHFWDNKGDYPDSVIKKVAPEDFEPYYYSSAGIRTK